MSGIRSPRSHLALVYRSQNFHGREARVTSRVVLPRLLSCLALRPDRSDQARPQGPEFSIGQSFHSHQPFHRRGSRRSAGLSPDYRCPNVPGFCQEL